MASSSQRGAQLLNSELGGKFKFNYSPSNGSVDNVRRVSLGDFHTAWGHVGQAFQSWNGIGLFSVMEPGLSYRRDVENKRNLLLC